MACACNKNKGGTNFLYKSPKGATRTYRTKMEAEAAQIKNGGGTIQPVSR